MSNNPFIVTQALPYANGPLHLGHILEATQVDIWVRFLRMQGEQVYFFCAEDAHGAAISISAANAQVTPEKWIEKMYSLHKTCLASFNISYDNYHTTHSKENFELSAGMYEKMKQKNVILKKSVLQLYDPEAKMFLADRMVIGNCPKCDSPEQYGDNCDNCGATYDAIDIANPRSSLSGTPPIQRSTEQLFVDLSKVKNTVWQWIESADIAPGIRNKLKEWFDQGLQNWDISRNSPYFGIPIPGEKDKYFYVWLDAPIGYLASMKNFCESNDIDMPELWGKESNSNVYHFIGKDIVFFHCIFWPAMLHLSNYQLPSGVVVHGFLTINGAKMSKSKGTFIAANDFLKVNNIDENLDNLRYMLASKLRNDPRDIDLNFEELVQKTNVDLVGKIVNIASRSSKILNKSHAGNLSMQQSLLYSEQELTTISDEIALHYKNRDTNLAMQSILKIADEVNQFINDQQPWKLTKEDEKSRQQEICSSALSVFAYIIAWMSPVTITLAEKVHDWLYSQTTHSPHWPTSNNPVRLPRKIDTFAHLKSRSILSNFDNVIKQTSE